MEEQRVYDIMEDLRDRQGATQVALAEVATRLSAVEHVLRDRPQPCRTLQDHVKGHAVIDERWWRLGIGLAITAVAALIALAGTMITWWQLMMKG